MISKTAPIAVITGGSRGLGRSMALHLAERGVHSVITYVANELAAREAVAEVKAKGSEALALRLDVGASDSFDAFSQRLRDELAKLGRDRFDYLINNAGHAYRQSIAETSEQEFDKLVAVHLKGTLFLTQKLLPLIADGGSILNVSTGLTRFASPGYAAYAAMKGAVEVLTRYMAKELGARGITVNALAPGATETDFGGGYLRDNEQLSEQLAKVTALGRTGQPDDIGAAVAQLLSPNTRWITGQRIEVSGGMNL